VTAKVNENNNSRRQITLSLFLSGADAWKLTES